MRFNRDDSRVLKICYARAVKEGKETFTFRKREFLVGYAKYLIEYLENNL